jgi:beta-xylosidase
LSFKNDVAAAHAQDARHWTVEASLQRGSSLRCAWLTQPTSAAMWCWN